MASFPVSRSSIFCLYARENGLVTSSLLPRPASPKAEASDNYPDAGGRNKLSPMCPEWTLRWQAEPALRARDLVFEDTDRARGDLAEAWTLSHPHGEPQLPRSLA